MSLHTNRKLTKTLFNIYKREATINYSLSYNDHEPKAGAQCGNAKVEECGHGRQFNHVCSNQSYMVGWLSGVPELSLR